jgi:hypothetical protein
MARHVHQEHSASTMEFPPNRPKTQPAKSLQNGRISRGKVYERATELAQLAGHPYPHVSQSAYEQAKRELTGESDPDRQQAVLDAIPQPDDEDDRDGRNQGAQLAERGSVQAEHDRMRQAARFQAGSSTT